MNTRSYQKIYSIILQMTNKDLYKDLLGYKVQLAASGPVMNQMRFIGVISQIVDDTWLKLIPFVPSDSLKEKAKEINNEIEIIPVNWPMYKRITTIDSIILLEKPDRTYVRDED